MIVESNQSHTDLAVLGYGNTAAFFELANDNISYESTVAEPYAVIELPFDFEVGETLQVNQQSENYSAEQMKALNKTPFKLASKP